MLMMDVELRVDAISDAFGFCDGIEKYCQYRALYMAQDEWNELSYQGSRDEDLSV